MNKIKYSTKGKDNVGEININTKDITLFLNKMTNPEENFNRFITEMISTEWHELGHKYDGQKKCTIWYCGMTDMVWLYLQHKQKKWCYSYSLTLEKIAQKSNKNHRTWKNQTLQDALLQ